MMTVVLKRPAVAAAKAPQGFKVHSGQSRGSHEKGLRSPSRKLVEAGLKFHRPLDWKGSVS